MPTDGNYAHMDGGSWMVDGEALVMGGDDGGDLHSGSVPEQRSWTPNLGFTMAAELRKVSRKSNRGLVFRTKGSFYAKGDERRGPRGRGGPRPQPRSHPRVGPAPAPGVAPPRNLLSPWLFSFKNPFSDFSGIFRELLNLVSGQWKPGYHGPACQGPLHLWKNFTKDQSLQAWRGSRAWRDLAKGPLDRRSRQGLGEASPGLAGAFLSKPALSL